MIGDCPEERKFAKCSCSTLTLFAKPNLTTKKMQIFHLSLRGLSHHSEIVQKISKKERQQHGLGIAEGGARTLDLEVGISEKIRATRSTD
jgi:hypothetical protein